MERSDLMLFKSPGDIVLFTESVILKWIFFIEVLKLLCCGINSNLKQKLEPEICKYLAKLFYIFSISNKLMLGNYAKTFKKYFEQTLHSDL